MSGHRQSAGINVSRCPSRASSIKRAHQGTSPVSTSTLGQPHHDDLHWHQDADVMVPSSRACRVPFTAPVPDTFPDGFYGTLAEFRTTTSLGSRSRFGLRDGSPCQHDDWPSGTRASAELATTVLSCRLDRGDVATGLGLGRRRTAPRPCLLRLPPSDARAALHDRADHRCECVGAGGAGGW